MNTLQNLSDVFFKNLTPDNTSDGIKSNDLTCLENALKNFLNTGTKEDAFVVYFCFCEIYQIFGNGANNTKKLLELLSDHEYHSGELLTKHRDHYAHSVYVFALGLAIFANNETYRKKYGKEYSEFMRYWGLTALFHDIGYPFQLAHEQIKAYCEELWGGNESNMFVSFGNVDNFISLSENSRERLSQAFELPQDTQNINDLLAYGVELRLKEGYERKKLSALLKQRVVQQPRFMDHGYFSAVLLLKQLLSTESFEWNVEALDVLTAILLHNNLNKYDILNGRPITLDEHPLSFMLILCDELQNWDRFAYGKKSKRDPIAYEIELEVSNETISANYIFDKKTTIGSNGEEKPNTSFEEISSEVFVAKMIGGYAKGKTYKGFIVAPFGVTAEATERPCTRKPRSYMSDNNIINLYDFAIAVHSSYAENNQSADTMIDEFANLGLEFKVSNILAVKSYASKLDQIGCFYSCKDLDLPIIEEFTREEKEVLSRLEHVRWVKEKISMGWKYGVEGTDYNRTNRNEKKLHKDIAPFDLLPNVEQKKDEDQIMTVLRLIRRLGSHVRIYRSPYGRKPSVVVAGVGHRYLSGDREAIKMQVKDKLNELQQTYNVTVQTSFAYGADQIIAECAYELGIATYAILPCAHDKFLKYVSQDALDHGVEYSTEDESALRLLLAQSMKCDHVGNGEDCDFEGAAQRNINTCDKLIAIWDGVKLPLVDANGKPIKRGGTYDCIVKALSADKEVIVIKTETK